jgi:lysophospholipase L1-like esterase
MVFTLKRRITGCAAALAVAAFPLASTGQLASASPQTSESQSPWHSRGGYVALGDSFSSGEGAGRYDPATNRLADRCHRSDRAYAPLLSDDSRRLRPLTFVACSGAATRDLYSRNATNPSEGPQLSALKRSTRVVTITIGGNDVVFTDVAKTCITVTKLRFGCSKNEALVKLVDARLGALAGSSPSPRGVTIIPMRTVLADIHHASPRAKIFVAGYPELFGDRHTHYSVDQTAPSDASCVLNPSLSMRVDFADAQWINAKTRSLNNVLRSAVRRAQRSGTNVEYVSASTFDGHGLCDSHDSWINPVRVRTFPTPLSESLHPTAEGQRKGYVRAFQRAGL